MHVHVSCLQLEAITIPLWWFLLNRQDCFSHLSHHVLISPPELFCSPILISHLFPNWVVSAFCHPLRQTYMLIGGKLYLKTKLWNAKTAVGSFTLLKNCVVCSHVLELAYMSLQWSSSASYQHIQILWSPAASRSHTPAHNWTGWKLNRLPHSQKPRPLSLAMRPTVNQLGFISLLLPSLFSNTGRRGIRGGEALWKR